MSTSNLESGVCRALLELGFQVRDRIRSTRGMGSDSRALGIQGGDQVFGIDRKVEDLVVAAMAALARSVSGVSLVCEGITPDGMMFFQGKTPKNPHLSILVDPIDGSRTLMYDKRGAWFLACASFGPLSSARLSNAFTSIMVELPTSKQGESDYFASIGKAALIAKRTNLQNNTTRDIDISPSRSAELRNGFGQVASFFPGTKILSAELLEEIANVAIGEDAVTSASLFDDQYISTGGQLVELMTGKDRFCCDLRPLLYEIQKKKGTNVSEGLCCHPYDLAGLALARRAGVIVTDAFGEELDAQFRVNQNVSWCGFANQKIQDLVLPVIVSWLKSHGIEK